MDQYLAIVQIINEQQNKSTNEQQNKSTLAITLQNIFAKSIQESIFGNSQIIALEML